MSEDSFQTLLERFALFSNFFPYLYLIGALVGINYFKTNSLKSFKVMTLYFLTFFVYSFYSKYVWKDLTDIGVHYSLSLTLIYNTLEVAFLGYILLFCQNFETKKRNLLAVLVLLSLGYFYYETISSTELSIENRLAYSEVISKILLICIAVWVLLRNFTSKNTVHDFNILSILCVLFYLSINTIYAVSLNFFLNESLNNDFVFMIFALENLFKIIYLLLIIFLMLRYRKSHFYRLSKNT